MIDIQYIKKIAEQELNDELFRELVEKEKQKFREKKSIWDKIFPFKIIILRKDK